MALFPLFTVLQSLDGKTITITDTTDYAGQGINIANVTRSIQVSDANGTLITTLTFPTNTALTLTYPITKDQYFSFVAVYLYSGSTYNKTVTFLATNFYQYAQSELIAKVGCDCGCSNEQKLCNNMTMACEAWYSAQYAFLLGAGVKAQSDIDDANTLINSLAGC